MTSTLEDRYWYLNHNNGMLFSQRRVLDPLDYCELKGGSQTASGAMDDTAMQPTSLMSCDDMTETSTQTSPPPPLTLPLGTRSEDRKNSVTGGSLRINLCVRYLML